MNKYAVLKYRRLQGLNHGSLKLYTYAVESSTTELYPHKHVNK